jgi:hypothetical protein
MNSKRFVRLRTGTIKEIPKERKEKKMVAVRIEFNEFLLMMAKQQDQTYSREALAEAFR